VGHTEDGPHSGVAQIAALAHKARHACPVGQAPAGF